MDHRPKPLSRLKINKGGAEQATMVIAENVTKARRPNRVFRCEYTEYGTTRIDQIDHNDLQSRISLFPGLIPGV